MNTDKRFEREIVDHVMTVIRDDGEYRHLRFGRPGTRCMQFDLLTWPGHLCYTGDMGTYVFSRVRDMFKFFRSPKGDWHDINLSYWAEKVLASDRDGIKEFSLDKFKREIGEWLDDYAENADLTSAEIAHLRADVAEEVIQPADNYDGEASYMEGMKAALEYRCGGELIFQDFWEIDSKVYTHRYIWCCHAIVWGISVYDKSREARHG